MSEERELGYISASIPLGMYTSWVEVIDKCVKELMRVSLCLPSEIVMERNGRREAKIFCPLGCGYLIKLSQKDNLAWYDGIPIIKGEGLDDENLDSSKEEEKQHEQT